MSQLVVLNLGNGNLAEGIPSITAQIWQENSTAPMQYFGQLPPAPTLSTAHSHWQKLYMALAQRLRQSRHPGIEFDNHDLPQVSSTEFHTLCQQLQTELNHWLRSEPFSSIDQHLRTKLSPAQVIRLILISENSQLRQFPWHLWSFFDDYPLAELALSTSEYDQVSIAPSHPPGVVRILAVLGNSSGINIEEDRAILAQVPNAKTLGSIIFSGS